MAGGSSAVPMIKRAVAEVIGEGKLMNPPNPRDLIALGAAYMGSIKTGRHANISFVTISAFNVQLGVKGGTQRMLIAAGQRLPYFGVCDSLSNATKTKRIRGDIYEGESDRTIENTKIGSCVLEFDEVRDEGQAKMAIDVTMDIEGYLKLECYEVGNKQHKGILNISCPTRYTGQDEAKSTDNVKNRKKMSDTERMKKLMEEWKMVLTSIKEMDKTEYALLKGLPKDRNLMVREMITALHWARKIWRRAKTMKKPEHIKGLYKVIINAITELQVVGSASHTNTGQRMNEDDHKKKPKLTRRSRTMNHSSDEDSDANEDDEDNSDHNHNHNYHERSKQKQEADNEGDDDSDGGSICESESDDDDATDPEATDDESNKQDNRPLPRNNRRGKVNKTGKSGREIKKKLAIKSTKANKKNGGRGTTDDEETHRDNIKQRNRRKSKTVPKNASRKRKRDNSEDDGDNARQKKRGRKNPLR